ncbi:MAG: DUF4426 domain-containing protein [Pseudomonadota bacterium]
MKSLTPMPRRWLISLTILLLPLVAQADFLEQFGDYTVHYNAITTDKLDPEVARGYGIQRSASRALVTISVIEGEDAVSGEPVTARVKGGATNRTGQTRRLGMREVRDDRAVYYLDTVNVSDEEVLRFEFTVSPDGSGQEFEVDFQRQFFID